jgi:hypothetical protein
MNREDIEEAIEVLEDASADMLTETGDENYYAEAIAILRQALVDGGNCYGDGTVYRGQRSKDSAVQTLWLRTRARGEK